MRPSKLTPSITHAAHSLTHEEAKDFYKAAGGPYYFEQATSRTGSSLANALRGGRKADPNVGSAIRFAEELERRLETIAVLRAIPPAHEPAMARLMSAIDDLPGLLSSAGSDARYVKKLTYGGAGMAVAQNITEALRVVRGLRPKLEAAWSLYDAMPKPERIRMTPEEQKAFWRKLDAEAEALG